MSQEKSLNLSKNSKIYGISTYFVSFLLSSVPQQLYNQQACERGSCKISNLEGTKGARTGVDLHQKAHPRELSLFNTCLTIVCKYLHAKGLFLFGLIQTFIIGKIPIPRLFSKNINHNYIKLQLPALVIPVGENMKLVKKALKVKSENDMPIEDCEKL